MKKRLSVLVLTSLIFSLFSCLTFSGNEDLKVRDKTVYETEPYWLYGVKREVRTSENYSAQDVYLVYTGGINGAATATEKSIGFARFKTAIEKYQNEPNFIIMDLGNLTNGNRNFLASKGQDAIDIAKNIGYDFILPGGMDLSFGDTFIENSSKFTQDNKNPYSAYNLLYEDGRTSIFPRYQLYDFSGYKLALVGFVAPSAGRVNGKGSIDINDDVYQFLSFIRLLKRQGIDGIVVSSYIPKGDEGYYVRNGGLVDVIAPEVDGIILVSESTRRNSSYDKNGTSISVMKSSFDSFGVTTIRLRNAVKDKITSHFVSAGDISLSANKYLKSDEAISNLIEEQKSIFREKYANIVAILPQEYKTTRSDLEQGNISNGKLVSLLLGTMKTATKADVTMFPANYIATDGYDMGILTPEDADSLYSDASVLRVISISPHDLYEMLENNAKYIFEGKSNYLNTNVRVVYDWDKVAIPFELPIEYLGTDSITEPYNVIKSIYINNEPISRDDTTSSIAVAFPSSMTRDPDYVKYFNKRGVNYNPLTTYVKSVLRNIYPPF